MLYGAVVGGPDKQDRFFDIRDDYPQTEIALDYNAPLVAAAVSRIARNVTQDPPYTRSTGSANVASGLPTDSAYPARGGGGLSQGAKIAIAVCGPCRSLWRRWRDLMVAARAYQVVVSPKEDGPLSPECSVHGH